MAQHDYVIANGTGAAVRSDLNGSLAAIVSNNSGATEPGTMYAYQWWADTTTGLLKLRNSANSAWISLRELDGTLTIEDGTAAAPGLAFTSDLNTGLFRVGADQLAISTGGTSRLAVSTTAVSSTLAVDVPLGAVGTPSITFTGDLNTGIWSPAADTIAFSEGGAEAMRIDSSSRLLVGTSSARSNFAGNTSTPLIQTEGTTASTSSASIVNNSNGSVGSTFNLGKSRASSVGGNTVVASGDQIGIINFQAADGTNLLAAASIEAAVDSTPGTNDMPGRLVFSTTVDGGSSPTEAFRINSFQKPIFGGPTIRCLGTYNATTASAANQFVDSAGDFYRSTSSIKYKTNVETIEDHYSDALLQCHPVWYQSTCEADNPDWGHWGFIAEEVAQIDPRLCFFKEEEDGSLEPEGVQYDRFVPHLLNLIKRQGEAIADLQAEVSALKGA